MELYDIISRTLHRWGQRHTEQLKRNLDATGKKDTGQLRASIQFSVDGTILQIEMEEYAKFIHEGRSPGKFPPVDEIRGWVERKGLTIQGSSAPLDTQQRQLAYLVGRKIAVHGIEPSPFIEDLPTDEIEEDLAGVITEWATQQILGQS